MTVERDARTIRVRSLIGLPLRSLTIKLMLAFLAVGLTGALLVALSVQRGTQRAFNQFIADRGRENLPAALSAYYQAHGSWDGVESVIEQARADQSGDPRHGPPIPALVSTDGTIVVGDRTHVAGTRISEPELRRGQPIVVGNTVVGWAINDFAERRLPGTPEADFLIRTTQAIVYSAGGAIVIALLLGILLARTLTQPLRELTVATRAMARGALGQQVSVRSRDELGVLASSFNQMSADLAHASAQRRQMTADIAHDLRTPLSVILGYTEALQEGKLPPTQDVFETMHIEAQHLQRLIDDLRTLSLADAGELRLTRQPLSPRALLDRAAATYREQAESRRIRLTVHGAPDLPEVNVDPERIAQVLGNLLSNALRFTPSGGTIALTAEAQDTTVALRVRDTGAGIAPEDLPHIFERFYRADASRQQDGSSGLGLAIAKSIVEAHGGHIGVESARGYGTTFTIGFPTVDTEILMHAA